MGGFIDIDELVPEYMGMQNIKLSLARPFDPRRVFHAIDLKVEMLAEAKTVGLVVPLELTITAPSKQNFNRHIYQRVVPVQVSFIPQEGGPHLVRLRETAHNSWWGALVIEVADKKNA